MTKDIVQRVMHKPTSGRPAANKSFKRICLTLCMSHGFQEGGIQSGRGLTLALLSLKVLNRYLQTNVLYKKGASKTRLFSVNFQDSFRITAYLSCLSVSCSSAILCSRLSAILRRRLASA